MWLESELSRLNGLFSNIQQPAIETILKTEDLASIQNLTSIELAGLRNGLLIPKVFLYLKFELTIFSIKWP